MKKILKPVRYALSAALLVGFVLTTPATASYEKIDPPAPVVSQQHKLALQYDVYAGGFKALNASLTMDLDQKAYDMALKAQTQGFIGSLFPWTGSYNTAGHTNDKGVLIPTIHIERSSWRKSASITEMSYDPAGKVMKTINEDNGKTTTDRNIDEVLADHAGDVLTGVLAIMQNAKNTNKCAGKFPVFDGKRRFNITLGDEGTEVLPPSRYSRFSGEAMRCTILVEPLAGFGKKDSKRGWLAIQSHTQARHMLPTLWLGRMKDSAQVVPVRMEIASEFGSVVAHLSKETAN